MKIKPEHFEYMQTTINSFLDSQGRERIISAYETGSFTRADKVKDLQTRFNFDLFNAAGLTKWACDNLYSYMSDAHIGTALKNICPKVNKKY